MRCRLNHPFESNAFPVLFLPARGVAGDFEEVLDGATPNKDHDHTGQKSLESLYLVPNSVHFVSVGLWNLVHRVTFSEKVE